MHNIYEKEGEEISENAKIRFLFKHVQHPSLQRAIEALKVRPATNDAITYTQTANHLSTAVSELSESIAKNCSISGISSTLTLNSINKSSTIYNAEANGNFLFFKLQA